MTVVKKVLPVICLILFLQMLACSEKKSEQQILEEQKQIEKAWIEKNQYSWGVSDKHANKQVRGFANEVFRYVKGVIVENGVLGFVLCLVLYGSTVPITLLAASMILQDLFLFQWVGIPFVILETIILTPLQLLGGCFGSYF
jgi:hypothetical protein